MDIFYWWMAIELCGLAVLPVHLALFKSLPDRGYPLSRITGILSLSFLAWNGNYFHLLPLNQLSIGCLVLLLAWICWFSSRTLRQEAIQFVMLHNTVNTFFECIGIAAFLWMLGLRSLGPDIIGAEKFTDFAILNSLVRTNQLPPLDAWLSGFQMNYYYWGHFLFALITRLTALPTSLAYQLSLASLFQLTVFGAASLGFNLSVIINGKKVPMNSWKNYLPALTAVLMVAMIGNLDGLLQILQKGTFIPMDYWRSSRIIPNTINEFPFFSFLHGDLHAHVMNLPVVLLCLSLLYAIFLSSGKRLGPLLSALIIVIGFIAAINPWDAIPALFLSILVLWSHQEIRSYLSIPLLLILPFLLFFPYMKSMPHSVRGIGINLQPTDFKAWLIIYGGFMLMLAFYLFRLPGSKKDLSHTYFHDRLFTGSLYIFTWMVLGLLLHSLVAAFLIIAGYQVIKNEINPLELFPDHFLKILILTGIMVLIGCEWFYIRDPYDASIHFRMNTVFKFYYFVWILLSIACSGIISRLWQRKQYYLMGAIGTILVASLCYPAGTILTRLVSRPQPLTLDGWYYLRTRHADDFALIQWLWSNADAQSPILEYPGEAYTYSGRISSNTGLPTVLGWANHELIWRDDSPLIEQRSRDIRLMWTTENPQALAGLLKQYKIKYVILGELEMQFANPGTLNLLKSLGKVVYQSGNSTILQCY